MNLAMVGFPLTWVVLGTTCVVGSVEGDDLVAEDVVAWGEV